MRTIFKHVLTAAVVAGMALPGSAMATNGYAAHGIGLKAKGMGGAGIAYPQDSVGIGINPAGGVWIENRVDVGLDIFRPDREASIEGNDITLSAFAPLLPPGTPPGLANGTYSGNKRQHFFIPEFGLSRLLSDNLSVGISVFGNGGMNSDYERNIPLFDLAGTGEDPGVNLAQLFVVPNLSLKLNEQHSLGVGLNLAAQSMEVTGIENFQAFSIAPDKVNNNDTDWSYGVGFRIGWLGKLHPMLTLGVTYATKTYMTKFQDYEGLFAEQGDFDIPENYGLGITFHALPTLDFTLDVMEIKYSDVNSIANRVLPAFECFFEPLNPNCQLTPLGDDDGAGFGWDDQTVYKFGISWAATRNLTLRGGYNYGETPISSSETFFNILAPATVEHHLTLGGTWTMKNGGELTVAYMHAFEETIDGENSIPPALGGGEANLTMSQDSLGVAYGWKF